VLGVSGARDRRGRYGGLSRRDKLTLAVMVGVPMFLVGFFILLPTILSIVLSFTNWNGITAKYDFVGLKNFIILASDNDSLGPIKNTQLYKKEQRLQQLYSLLPMDSW